MSSDLEKQLKELENNPDNPEILCSISKIYKNQKEYDLAKNYLQKALLADPDYCPATCTLITILIDTGHYTDAINLFQAALDTHMDDEKYSATLFNALFALFLLHKINLESPTKTDSPHHNYEEMFFKMGKAFKENKLFDAASKIFEVAYSLSSSNIRLILDLSECYIVLNEDSKAESILVKLTENYPDDEDVYTKLAEVYNNLGHYNSSIIYAHKVLKMNSDNINVQNLLAYSHIMLEEYDQAIEIYQNQIKTSPEEFKPYRNLYLAYKAAQLEDDLNLLIEELKSSYPEYIELIEYEIKETFDQKEIFLG